MLKLAAKLIENFLLKFAEVRNYFIHYHNQLLK